MSITFYHNPQSSAARIHLTLEELKVPYETVMVDLQAGDQKKPDFLALNPNGQVPTIVIDGTPMFESIAIQIYLGERFGVERGLWPALNSPEHMQALTWLCWAQVSLGTPMFRYMGVMKDPAQAEAALVDVKRVLGVLDGRLGARGNLVGEAWTLADSDAASVLDWCLYMTKIEMSEYRHVNAWLDRWRNRPAVKAARGQAC